MNPTRPGHHNTTAVVQVHDNRNATLPLAAPGTYLATLNPDGSILLEPAQTLTNAQIAKLAAPRRTLTTEQEREARRAVARALLAADPGVTGPEVLAAQHEAGLGASLRTAYNDLSEVKSERSPVPNHRTHPEGTTQ